MKNNDNYLEEYLFNADTPAFAKEMNCGAVFEESETETLHKKLMGVIENFEIGAITPFECIKTIKERLNDIPSQRP